MASETHKKITPPYIAFPTFLSFIKGLTRCTPSKSTSRRPSVGSLAPVAKLVNAAASKAAVRQDVWVQVPPGASPIVCLRENKNASKRARPVGPAITGPSRRC